MKKTAAGRTDGGVEEMKGLSKPVGHWSGPGQTKGVSKDAGDDGSDKRQ
jgi:hypothetical protein